jgi:hypothetical protein
MNRPTVDRRRRFRVFLASSLSLREERAGFDAAVLQLANDPAFDRICVPAPIRWETAASGAHPEGANRKIQLSVGFTELDVVIVAIGDRVGQWTREEYERALQLFQNHEKPRLLLYIRNPPPGEEPPVGVTAFREQAFGQNVIASPYSTPGEMLARIPGDVLKELGDEVDTDPHATLRLRRQFLAWGWTNLLLGVLTVAVSAMMAFPTDGVTYTRVLGLLASPVVLMLTTLGAVVSYRRVLTAFRNTWRSSKYTDDTVWESFAGIVPSSVTPRQTTSKLERHSVAMQARVLLVLGLAFASGPIGALNAVFNEILLWEYAVGWHANLDPAATAPGGYVVSTYVDSNRSWWPFGLQNEKVRAFARDHPDDQIHVHAFAQFCNPTEVQAKPLELRFRCNQGPEVKLPLFAWILVTACVLGCVAALLPAVWLATFRRTLSLLPWEE